MAGTVIVTIGAKTWTGSYLSTISERVAGLANVASIPMQTCAFFDMGVEQAVNVTTAQMLFNLDIAFMDANGNIVQIERNVAPSAVVIVCPAASFFMECNANELALVSVADVTTIAIAPAQSAATSLDINSIVGPMVTIMMLGMLFGMMKGVIKPQQKATFSSEIYAKRHASRYAIDTRQDIMGSARDEVGMAFKAMIACTRNI